MINKDNELNASKVTYSEQRNRIIEEFEKIKKEVMEKTNILQFIYYYYYYFSF